LRAPRERVYRALLDRNAIARWRVPNGMTSHVHSFDGRLGGTFRISLTYDGAAGVGKTTAQTDTFCGVFVELVPNERVVEEIEFETANPSLCGQMTLTIDLADAADGGTDLFAVHDGLPPGVSPADNETGWRMALDKLAAFVELRPPAAAAPFARPSLVDRLFNSVMGALVGVGIGPSHMRVLEVRGRRSGTTYSLPVDLLIQAEALFLVAPRGRAQWVRNAEAQREVTLRRGKQRIRYRLRTLSDSEKPPILKAYLDRFRREVQRFFPIRAGSPVEEFIPLAGRYPAFELMPIP